MANDICLNCFKVKGAFDVCPHCGWVEGTLPEQAFHLQSGVTLSGRYIIGTVTGFGGFGTIYKAWDSRLSAIVAIKEFYPAGLVSRIPGTTEVVIFSGEKRDNYMQAKGRFLSEARSLAMFNKNPSIVNVYNFFEENNTAYIVMEYLDGLALRDYLTQNGGPLPVEEALEIVRPVMDALIAIHEKGIVHRDIHPGNIFITTGKKIKLLDFGAARLSTGEDESTLTVVVTQGYASPEQYRTKSKQGPFTDIYGLGATLYRMITGALPEESIDRQVKDTLKKPSEIGIGISEKLSRATMKAMALKPEIRFQKVSEFRDAVFRDRRIDYPEVEYKKRTQRRGVIITGVMAALAVFIVVIGMSLNATPTLDDVVLEPDTIRLMVPVSDDEAARDTEAQAWQEIVDGFRSNNEENGRIEVDLQLVPVSEYAEKTGALQDGQAPTLFSIDGLENIDMDSYASLDLLYDSLNPDEYLFMDRFEALFPSKKMMPIGFNAYTLYGNNQAARTEGKTIPEEIDEYAALFDNENSVRVKTEDLQGLLLLYGAEADENGSFRAGEGLAAALAALKQSYVSQNADPEEDPMDVLREDRLIYLFADTSDLRAIQNAMPGYYRVVDIVNGEVSAGSFADIWVVSETATENQKNAAMKFIVYLLNDLSQDLLYLQQDAATPINKAVFEQYIQLNPDFAYLRDRTARMRFAGEYASELRAFSGDVYEEVLLGDRTDEEIAAFLDGYER